MADVVEVVRCKDCKEFKPYKKPVEDFDGRCRQDVPTACRLNIGICGEVDEDFYCQFGERKENGVDKTCLRHKEET